MPEPGAALVPIRMKAARLIVLGVALTAGLGAAYLMMGTKPPEPVRLAAPPPSPVVTDSVLVASRDLGFGSVITDADMRWQSWPKDQVPPGVISQSRQPSAMQDVKGSIVRSNFVAGEPLRPERLVKGNGSGFLSAVLPTGLRAVAIDIADQGKTAGGFILPNDHVDVIRTFHPEDAPAAYSSETLLSNIRVLAIGQAVQEKAAERTIAGSTATLELTPDQAEKVILAQRTSQLTLSLRSMTDSDKTDAVKPAEKTQAITIIRFGTPTQSQVR